MKKYVVIGYLVIATTSVAQEKISCEQQLLVTQKQVLILQSSRSQTEATLAQILAKFEKEAENNVSK